MAYEDLPLRPPERGSPPAPPRGSSPTRWVVLGAAAVAAISILALWWLSRAQPGTAPPPPTSATEAAARSNRPKGQPLDLPGVDNSDSLVREMVAALSRHPLLSRLLATDGVVRGATLAVVQIGDGKTPAVPLAALRPITRLQIQGTASGPVDPRSYARWEGAANALVSVSPADAAQLYVNLETLFDQAYRDLGYPQADFDEAIVRAIRMLESTPEITTNPVLLQRPGYLEHEDPGLRGLQPVQKQLLLLGPENRRRVLTWLRQFAHNLDLNL
jgi:hypothetical protein